jgi:methionine biosynthesis protein MetW
MLTGISSTLKPRPVLENLLRIGRHAIVSFPNFGHWEVRSKLVLTGRMPQTSNLPDRWYETPNAHLCTIKDFADLCRAANAEVERSVVFNWSGRQLSQYSPLGLQNLLGEKAVFLMRRGATSINAVNAD